MKNASFHHFEEITELCSEVGVEFIYLPPHSPGLFCYLHTSHILHGVIKPENVLVKGGQALLTDFGLPQRGLWENGKASQPVEPSVRVLRS